MEIFETFFNKAVKCFNENNFKLALHYFNKCLELDPENYLVYNNRGLIYYYTNEYQLAIQDYNNSLSLNPNILNTYFNRGLAYQQFEIYDKALEDFRFVKYNSPEFKNVELEIQKTLNLKSGNSITLKYISNFTDDGNNPNVALNRGKYFYDKNDFINAIDSFTNAINYKIDFVEAYLHRALCYSTIKQYDKAIDDYETAEKYIIHKDVIKANIGNLYAEMGQLELSLDYLNKAVEIDPLNYKNYYFRGITKSKLNKIDSSIFDFTKALELKPNDFECLDQRCVNYVNSKKYSLAKNDLIILIKLQPDNPNFYYIMGLILFNEGDKINSLNYLKTSQNLGYKNAKDFIIQNFSY